MKEIYQKKFYDLVSELMDVDFDEQYKSVMSMVYTLIEDDKIEKLDIALRQNFPNYYDSAIPLILSEN